MIKLSQTHKDAIRIALIITISMLIGKFCNFHSPVYFALYPCIIATKIKDYSWRGLVKTLLPTLIVATGALLVVEFFSTHPFIMWTLTLLMIDFMRKKANTAVKRAGLIMPMFNWILIVIFAQQTSIDLPTSLYNIMAASITTIMLTKLMVKILPPAKHKFVPAKIEPVTYQQRFIAVTSIGLGCAILMNINLLSATFCLVPVIIAVSQTTLEQFHMAVKQRFITQLGGCAIAVLFAFAMMGQQQHIVLYGVTLLALLIFMSTMFVRSDLSMKDIHSDAMLATVLPIQLYITPTDMGIQNSLMRGWELAVTLAILLTIYYIVKPKNQRLYVNH